MTAERIDLWFVAFKKIRVLAVFLSAVAGLYPLCPAIAGPMDNFGAGAPNIAMGGTKITSSDSYEASHYNPAALGLIPNLEVGVGLSVLPTVKGTVRMDLADTSLQNYLDIDVGLTVLANAGLLFEPISGLTVGMSYRGAGETDITLPVDAAITSVPVYLTFKAATVLTRYMSEAPPSAWTSISWLPR